MVFVMMAITKHREAERETHTQTQTQTHRERNLQLANRSGSGKHLLCLPVSMCFLLTTSAQAPQAANGSPMAWLLAHK